MSGCCFCGACVCEMDPPDGYDVPGWITRVTQERDEAQAEAHRLRTKLMLRAQASGETLRERNELHAEVERLRELLYLAGRMSSAVQRWDCARGAVANANAVREIIETERAYTNAVIAAGTTKAPPDTATQDHDYKEEP